MNELLPIVLICTALVGLMLDVLCLLLVILCVRWLKTFILNPLVQGEPHVWTTRTSTSTITFGQPTTPAEPTLATPETPVRSKAFPCEHCGKPVEGTPVRGIATDEGNFLVYTCPACGKETATPSDA